MSNNSDPKYPVGFGKPPEHTRFRKGVSGNPRGRPKGRLNAATVLARTLSESITIKERGVHKKVTKLRALMMQVVNKALAGDVRAIAFVTNLYALAVPETTDSAKDKLSDSDQKILERMLNRMQSDKENKNEN